MSPRRVGARREREADVNEPEVGREPEHDPRDSAREESQQPAHLLCIGSGQGLLDLPRYPKGLRRNVRGPCREVHSATGTPPSSTACS